MSKEQTKNFFHVPRSQMKGYLLLGFILILVVFTPTIYNALFYKPEVVDFEKDREQIEAFVSSLQFQKASGNKKYSIKQEHIDLDYPERSAAKATLTPFPFNPNNLPVDQWLAMGFSQKQVQSIKKYEQKGGRFYTKADVKKLWAISPEEYSIIAPFIQLPDTLSGKQYFNNKQKEEKTYQIVELNAADTSALKTLPGIGSMFARRIYNYKTSLGGFHTKYQLLEIKDLDSAKFSLFFAFVIISSLSFSQETQSIQWKSIQDGLALNQTAKKPVFIDFYTTWCGWCTRMDQTTFKDAAVIKVLNEEFIPVKFNAESSDSVYYKGVAYGNPNPGRSRSTHAVAYAILGPRIGYPTFAVLDENNELIIIAPGYQQAPQILQVLKFVTSKAYQTQTWNEWSATKSE